jgi:hypothetical protein
MSINNIWFFTRSLRQLKGRSLWECIFMLFIFVDIRKSYSIILCSKCAERVSLAVHKSFSRLSLLWRTNIKVYNWIHGYLKQQSCAWPVSARRPVLWSAAQHFYCKCNLRCREFPMESERCSINFVEAAARPFFLARGTWADCANNPPVCIFARLRNFQNSYSSLVHFRACLLNIYSMSARRTE